jgi:hypothetical protein
LPFDHHGAYRDRSVWRSRSGFVPIQGAVGRGPQRMFPDLCGQSERPSSAEKREANHGPNPNGTPYARAALLCGVSSAASQG